MVIIICDRFYQGKSGLKKQGVFIIHCGLKTINLIVYWLIDMFGANLFEIGLEFYFPALHTHTVHAYILHSHTYLIFKHFLGSLN